MGAPSCRLSFLRAAKPRRLNAHALATPLTPHATPRTPKRPKPTHLITTSDGRNAPSARHFKTAARPSVRRAPRRSVCAAWRALRRATLHTRRASSGGLGPVSRTPPALSWLTAADFAPDGVRPNGISSAPQPTSQQCKHYAKLAVAVLSKSAPLARGIRPNGISMAPNTPLQRWCSGSFLARHTQPRHRKQANHPSEIALSVSVSPARSSQGCTSCGNRKFPRRRAQGVTALNKSPSKNFPPRAMI